MQTGGEAATLSLAISPPPRGGGIWIEQEKSTITDVLEMRESMSSGPGNSGRHARTASHVASRPSVSLSRYDEESSVSDGRSEHSRSKIYDAM